MTIDALMPIGLVVLFVIISLMPVQKTLSETDEIYNNLKKCKDGHKWTYKDNNQGEVILICSKCDHIPTSGDRGE